MDRYDITPALEGWRLSPIKIDGWREGPMRPDFGFLALTQRDVEENRERIERKKNANETT